VRGEVSWTEPAAFVELSVMEQRYQVVLEVLSSLLPVTEVAARYEAEMSDPGSIVAM
jgi:hypothetical protein